MKGLSDKAAGESRDLTAEEYGQYEAMETDLSAKTREIERLEREEGIAPQMTRAAALPEESREVATPPAGEPREDKRTLALKSPEYRAAFVDYLRGGRGGLSPESRAALQVGTDSEGGFAVPDEWAQQLVEARTHFGTIRGLATVFQTSESGDVHVPKVVEPSTQTADIVAEEAAFVESEDTFAEVVFGSFKIGTIIKASDEIIHDALFDVSGFVLRRAARAIGLKENNYFVTGTGTAQPRGITVGLATGVTAASATAITTDELLDLYYSVARPYRVDATFLLADSTEKLIRKLKDADNQYIWQPGLQAGTPNTLLGRPVEADPHMPAAAAGAESIVFGALSEAYWIRDVERPVIKVLNERYAENGQVGYRVHVRTDGDVVDATAGKCLSQL